MVNLIIGKLIMSDHMPMVVEWQLEWGDRKICGGWSEKNQLAATGGCIVDVPRRHEYIVESERVHDDSVEPERGHDWYYFEENLLRKTISITMFRIQTRHTSSKK